MNEIDSQILVENVSFLENCFDNSFAIHNSILTIKDYVADTQIRKTGGKDIKIQSQKPMSQNSLNASLDLNIITQVVTHHKEDKNIRDLKRWGLPLEIVKKYELRGITKMFEWQVSCLSKSEVLLHYRNLVYSAPTSAGKTLVAEILTIKTILERQKKVLIILPFVSIVREKMFYFQDILSSSGIRVEGFMGSQSPPGGLQAVHVAICTIEKANSLINRLLDEGNISELGAVVVDELHLLGDSHRGYILELLLTKIKYISLQLNIKIQIIGMSATLPNLEVLASWLDADLFVTDFRPIPLEEYCLVGNKVLNKHGMCVRSISKQIGTEKDNEGVISICLETIKDGCSILIFCMTKNRCENLAQVIASTFFKLGCTGNEMGTVLRTQLNSENINEVLEQLKNCPVGLDNILRNIVSFGVAYHHAGLTFDERDIIEGAFKSGAIRVLVATSTLSSGVNLPARKVIIRTPVFQKQPINILTYKQMIGRAGRMGRDVKGESILICTEAEKKIGFELMAGILEPVKSCINSEDRYMRAVLEIIASQVACSKVELDLYSKCTLLFNQEEKSQSQMLLLENTLDHLRNFELIRVQNVNDGDQYVATSLGKACLSSSMAPNDGLSLFCELQKARQCMVLENDLHLIYLVTPYSVSSQWNDIDWLHLLTLWEALTRAMKKVGELVGVQESFIVQRLRGSNRIKMNQNKLNIHKRFYTALALQDLVNEVPLSEVARKFQCARGFLQGLQQAAATFAGMVTAFCRQLGWKNMELLISQFQDRLHFGIHSELIDLMKLSSLNGVRARALFDGGFEAITDVASADVNVIENILLKAVPFQSEKETELDDDNDLKKRNKIKNIWITGNCGLTAREAAHNLILEARKYLQLEMGVTEIKWKEAEDMKPCGDTLGINLISKDTNTDTKPCSETINVNLIPKDTNTDTKPCGETINVNLISKDMNTDTKPCGDTINVNLTSKDTNTYTKPYGETINVNLISKDMNMDTELFNDNLDINLISKQEHKGQIMDCDEQPQQDHTITNAEERKSFVAIKNVNYSVVNNKNDDEITLIKSHLTNNNNESSLEDELSLGQEKRRCNPSKQNDIEKEDSKSNESPILNGSMLCPTDSPMIINKDDIFWESLNFTHPLDNISKVRVSDQTYSPEISFGDAQHISIENGTSLKSTEIKDLSLFPSDESDSSLFEETLQLECLPNTIDYSSGKQKSKSNNSTHNVTIDAQSILNAFTSSLEVNEDDEDIKLVYEDDNKDDKLINLSQNVEIENSQVTFAINNTYYRSPLKREKDKNLLTSFQPLPKKIRTNSRLDSAFITLQSKESKYFTMKVKEKILNCYVLNDKDLLQYSELINSYEGASVYLDIIPPAAVTEPIGTNIIRKTVAQPKNIVSHAKDLVKGIAMCFSENVCIYLNLTYSDDQCLKKSLEDFFRKRSLTLKMLSLKSAYPYLKPLFGSKWTLHCTDLLLAEWLIQNDERIYDIFYLMKKYCNIDLGVTPIHIRDEVIELKKLNTVETTLLEAWSVQLVAEEQQRHLLQQYQDINNVIQTETHVSRILAECECSGLVVDRQLASKLLIDVRNSQEILQKKAFKICGYHFNFNSSKDVAKVLGIYKGRKVSTKKSVLTAHNSPMASIIIYWRKLNAILTKTLYPLTEKASIYNTDNRINPSYTMHTCTGRITMREPNLQNVPRTFSIPLKYLTLSSENDLSLDVIEFNCRNVFKAQPGHIFVSADYCQLEMRILTHYSRDPVLTQIMRSDVDVFKAIAASWSCVSEEQVDDDLRQKAKQLCYGILYGMGNRTLSQHLDVTEAEAAVFMDSFYKTYPSIRVFTQSIIDSCKKQGYVETLKKRRRYLPDINSTLAVKRCAAERQAVNTTIQGSAADIAKAAMCAIHNATDHEPIKPRLILQMHDELIYEVPETNHRTFVRLLKRVMEDSVRLNVPLPVKVKSGLTWGTLEEIVNV